MLSPVILWEQERVSERSQLKISLEHFCHAHKENRCTGQNVLALFSKARPRENEGTEREAPGPALGICHVHESYF